MRGGRVINKRRFARFGLWSQRSALRPLRFIACGGALLALLLKPAIAELGEVCTGADIGIGDSGPGLADGCTEGDAQTSTSGGLNYAVMLPSQLIVPSVANSTWTDGCLHYTSAFERATMGVPMSPGLTGRLLDEQPRTAASTLGSTARASP